MRDPPPRIFASVVTIFAGYWRPSGLMTRCFVAVFFLLVRLQRWFGFAPRLVSQP